MKAVLLIDFGSTYTKVTAVDLDTETLLGTAAAYTTIETDINDGLEKARALLEEKTGKLEFCLFSFLRYNLRPFTDTNSVICKIIVGRQASL